MNGQPLKRLLVRFMYVLDDKWNLSIYVYLYVCNYHETWKWFVNYYAMFCTTNNSRKTLLSLSWQLAILAFYKDLIMVLKHARNISPNIQCYQVSSNVLVNHVIHLPSQFLVTSNKHMLLRNLLFCGRILR